MFEGLIADQLNAYLGKYILNLDDENLRFSIFNGNLELTDLKLRSEALFELGLPIEVKASHVGRIHVSMSWTSLYSSPVVVNIEDVYILAGPATDQRYDASKHAALQAAIKQQKLELLDGAELAKQDAQSVSASEQSFTEKLTTTIVNNIQVSINQIHIRYEDSVSIPGQTFACGIMLRKLSAQTTTAQWKPAQIDAAASRIHKLVNMDGLSVYWNPFLKEQCIIHNKIHTNMWQNHMKNAIESHRIISQDLDFIIKPIGATCKLVMNKDKQSIMPQLLVNFTMDDIELLISRHQFRVMLNLNDSFKRMAVKQQNMKYSPTTTQVKGYVADWWHYAYNVVVNEKIRPFSWQNIRQHRELYRKYKQVYKQKLRALVRGDDVDDTEQSHLEAKLDIANIVLAREQAKLEFSQESPSEVERVKKPVGWWDHFIFGPDSDEEEEVVIHTKSSSRLSWLNQMTPDDKAKLYAAIGYDENENIKHVPQYVAHKLDVKLTSCSVSLVNFGKEVVKVSLGNLVSSFENRPDSGGFGFTMKTQSFAVEGVSIGHELVPLITSGVGVYAPTVSHIFSFEFEKAPLHLEADYSIRVNVQPMEIVYDKHAVTEMIAYFQVPNVSVEDVKLMAQQSLYNITQLSRAGLQYAIRQHKTTHISVNMRSPYIVIPEYGTLHRSGNVVVIDFGKLKVESELQPKNTSLEERTLSEIESLLYDKFNVTITDVKILVADSAEDWHTAQTKPDSEFHVLPSVGIQLAFFNSAHPQYKQLPQQKVEAKLPTLKLNLSDEKLQMFMDLYKHVPLPSSDSMMGIGDEVDGCEVLKYAHHMDEKDVRFEPSVQEIQHMKRSVLRNSILRETSKRNSRLSSADVDYYSASDHSDEEIDDWARDVDSNTLANQSSSLDVSQIFGRFTLGEVVIHISKAADRIDTPYLMLRINRLCVDTTVTSHSVVVQASLAAVQLVDKIHLGSSGEYLEMLSSPSESALITVFYRKVDIGHPEFTSVYKGVEQCLLIHMSNVSAVFHRAAVLYLTNFTQGLLLSMHSGAENATRISKQTSHSVAETPSQQQTKQHAKEPPGPATNLHLVTQLDNLEVKLCDQENDFAKMQVKGLKGKFILHSRKFLIQLRLTDFSIDDMTENTLHPKILMIEDDKVFDFKCIHYLKTPQGGDPLSSKHSKPTSIRLRIGQIQATFLYKFISEMMKFQEPLVNRELTKAYTQAAQKAIQHQFWKAQEEGTFVKIAITIKSPMLFVPQHSESTNLLVFKLSEISISNKAEETRLNHGLLQRWDNIHMKMDELKMSRVKMGMSGHIVPLHTIIEPTNFYVKVNRALAPIHSNLAFDIKGKLHLIQVNVTQMDLKVIMAVLSENMKEISNKPDQIDAADLLPLMTDRTMSSLDSVETVTSVLTANDLVELVDVQESNVISKTGFSFLIEGTNLTLFSEDIDLLVPTSPVGDDEVEKLSRFEIGQIDVSGTFHEGNFEVGLLLQSVAMDDVRDNSQLPVKRLIQSSVETGFLIANSPPMVNMKYRLDSKGYTDVSLDIEMIRVNICMAYLIQVANFFRNSLPESHDTTQVKDMARPVSSADNSNSHFTFTGHFKRPELVLFAEPTQLHSRVLVLKANMSVVYSRQNDLEDMKTNVNQLQIFSGLYGVGKQSSSMVLFPCDIEFKHVKESSSHTAVKMTLDVSDVRVHISPTSLYIVSDVVDVLNKERKVSVPADEEQTNSGEYFDLWKIRNISPDSWRSPVDEPDKPQTCPFSIGRDPVESFSLKPLNALVMFEVEQQNLHVPRLCFKSCVQAELHDWSRQMRGEATIDVDVSCYNEGLSVWEPLLERVMVAENNYRPWQMCVKMVQARSHVIACGEVDTETGRRDELDSNIHYLLSTARAQSESSETETDSETEMTVIRPKLSWRKKLNSDNSAGAQNSVQGDSDSEPEPLSMLSTNLDSLFSSDSSEDSGQSDDEGSGMENDRPVFLTSIGPVKVKSAATKQVDLADGPVEDDTLTDLCTYIVLDSQDKLLLNVTPNALDVVTTIAQTLSEKNNSTLQSIHDLPCFEIHNDLDIDVSIVLSPEVLVHPSDLHGVTLVTTPEAKLEESLLTGSAPPALDDVDGVSFISGALANVGQTIMSAGPLVFDPETDDDDNHHNIKDVHKNIMNIKMKGFNDLYNISLEKTVTKLIRLMPAKNDTNYCFVYDMAIKHGRKIATFRSPLRLHNHLDIAIDVLCEASELGSFMDVTPDSNGFVKMSTVQPQHQYNVPLYAAYHCRIYLQPAMIGYEKTTSSIWWQEMSKSKEKTKYVQCPLKNGDDDDFFIKVICENGSVTRKSASTPDLVPHHDLHLYPPFLLHNFLPYDIQFSIQDSAVKRLRHGENVSFCNTDLSAIPKLQLQLLDYLGLDWTGVLELSSDMEEFKAVNMECDTIMKASNRQLSLSVHVTCVTSMHLSIYSPYWIVNKTGLPILIRGSRSEAVYENDISQEPLLFRFKKHRRKKAKLKVYNSKWTHSFPLDTVGTSGVVICNEKERTRKYQFMLQIQLSRLKLTKIVTVMPYFLVINKTIHQLSYMEENEQADLWLDIAPNQCASFWPATDTMMMYVKYSESNVYSQHFYLHKPHTTVLHMYKGSALKVEVAGGTDTSMTITFLPYEHGDAPVRIDNLCDDVFIKLHQKNQSQASLLSPSRSVLYTWDNPTAERTLMWNVYNRKRPSYPAFISKDGFGEVALGIQTVKGKRRSANCFNTDSSTDDEDSDLDVRSMITVTPTMKNTRTDKVTVFWVSYLDGLQRTLLFTQDERIARRARKLNEAEPATLLIYMSLSGVGVSLINARYEEVAFASLADSAAIWQIEVKGKWKALNVELASWLEAQWSSGTSLAQLEDLIQADFDEMEMKKPFQGSLRRIYNPAVWLQYSKSAQHDSLHAKIHRLQVDNQLNDAYYTTVLYPTSLPAYMIKKSGPKPFIEMMVTRRQLQDSKVKTFKYVKVLVQALNLQIDKGFILSVLDIFSGGQSEKESAQLDADLVTVRTDLKDLQIDTSPQRFIFEHLHLSPLKLRISFSLDGTVRKSVREDKAFISDIVDFFMNSVGATMTEITDVELRMAFFERRNMAMTPEKLMSEVQGHYVSQAIQQAYVFILGLDVLGNPYGLVKDFTQGLGDFFYEPFMGMIHSPDQFGENLVRGIQSLIGHTIGSVAGSIALITGSLGKGLAMLSFDSSYRKRRRQLMLQHPKNLPTSLLLAGQGFLMGVVLGLSGLAVHPVRGVRTEGIEGFFKGIGKGLLGLITKPTGGAIDMLSMAFDGIRRTAEMGEDVIIRMRLPRHINPLLGLQPFSPYQAVGMRLLHSVAKHKYADSDIYWAHVPLSKEEKSDIVLISDTRLLRLETCRFWGDWDVELDILLSDIISMACISEHKLLIKVKQSGSGANLFESEDQLVTADDTTLLPWIQSKVEEAQKMID